MNEITIRWMGERKLRTTFSRFERPRDEEFFRRLGTPDDRLNKSFHERLQKKLSGVAFAFISLWECEVTFPEGCEYGEAAWVFWSELYEFVRGLWDTEDEEFNDHNFIQKVDFNGMPYQWVLYYMGSLQPAQLQQARAMIDRLLPA